MLKNILIIGDGGRKDILSMFDNIKENTHLIFILHKNQISKNIELIYNRYGSVVFWEDYKDSLTLLKELKINSVVFFQFGTYNEVALNVSCKVLKVKTYMLSHGLSHPERYHVQRQRGVDDYKKNINRLKSSTLGVIISKMKNSFYFNTLARLNTQEKSFLNKFFKIRSKYPELITFEKIESEYLKLDTYICFNQNCVKWYKIKHQLLDNELDKCTKIGFPVFDNLYNESFKDSSENKNIMFIDQHFYEHNVLGWTKEYKHKLIHSILEAIGNASFYVKTHPLNEVSFWDGYKTVTVIKDELEFKQTIEKTALYIGFNSTLLLPLASMKNKVIFAFENHPKNDQNPLSSSFLTNSGVAKQINSIDEFKENLKKIEELKKEQNKNKPLFIKNWLHKFDGRAKIRLMNILSAS